MKSTRRTRIPEPGVDELYAAARTYATALANAVEHAEALGIGTPTPAFVASTLAAELGRHAGRKRGGVAHDVLRAARTRLVDAI